MFIIGCIVGVIGGWLIPQPTLTYYAPGTSIGERVQLTTWVWRWMRDKVRDAAGMN